MRDEVLVATMHGFRLGFRHVVWNECDKRTLASSLKHMLDKVMADGRTAGRRSLERSRRRAFGTRKPSRMYAHALDDVRGPIALSDVSRNMLYELVDTAEGICRKERYNSSDLVRRMLAVEDGPLALLVDNSAIPSSTTLVKVPVRQGSAVAL